jgi:uncharacterized protein
MTEWTILLGMLIITIAGFTQGLTSFGFALLSMPILSSFIPLKVVIPIIVILSLFSNIAILFDCKKHIRMKQIWILILSSLVAAPFGALILRVANASYIKMFIGPFIVLFAVLLLSGVSFRVRNEKLAFVPVGLTSGLLNGSISLSGPPVALFLTNQGVEKHVFRANITAYALILNLITILTYGYTGMLNAEVVRYTVWFLPAMFGGVYLGSKALRFMSEKVFKKITLYLLIISGAWTLLTGLI